MLAVDPALERSIRDAYAAFAPLDDRFFHVLRMEAGRVVDFAWFLSADEGRRAVGL